MAAMTRGARSLPKTSLKNTVAMSRLLYSWSFTDTAHSYTDVSACLYDGLQEVERYKRYVDENIEDGDDDYCHDGRPCKYFLRPMYLAHHLVGRGRLAKSKVSLQYEFL